MNGKPLTIKTAWLSILAGILLAYAPSWMEHPQQSNYDAPWVHPSLENKF